MIGDRELWAFRRDYYALFVSLLWREPADELIGALGPGLPERVAAAEALHGLLGAGWTQIAAFLAGTPPASAGESVSAEYTRLFIDPYGREVNPYESYYLTGNLFDRPLAIVRSTLEEIGIARQEGYTEPEDFLAFELDVMRRLVERQGESADPDAETQWVGRQATFLRRHLLVWAPAAARDLAEAKHAVFYRGVARLLQGFLELERELFEGWGSEPLRSLDDTRQRFSALGQWKGPLFDPGGG